MIRQPIDGRTRLILGISSFVVLVLAYGAMSYRAHAVNRKNTTIPNLSQFGEYWWNIGMDFREFVAGEDKDKEKASAADDAEEESRVWIRRKTQIWKDMWTTYRRLFLGMLAGVVLSFVVGMAMGCFTPAEAFFLPPVAFFARIPPTAMMVVYFVLFGTDEFLFIGIVALGIFPTLAQSIFQAVRADVDDHTLNKSYTLGASVFEVIFEVVFRQILPRIIQSVQLHFGPAMVYLIATEMVAPGNVGVGYTIRLQSKLLEYNLVYTYLFILGATGLLIDGGLTWSRRKLCPWFGE